MDILEQNIADAKKKVELVYTKFNSDTMSHDEFDTWIADMVRDMYAYQITRFTPKTKK